MFKKSTKKETDPLIEESKSSVKEEVKQGIENMSNEEIITLALQIICILHTVVISVRYIWCFFRLDARIILNSPFYIIPFCILPFCVWVYSTSLEYWNFHNRKMFFLHLYSINAALTASQPIYSLLWKLLIPQILKLKPNQALTQSMIVWMCRIAVFLPLGLMIAFILYTVFHAINSEEGKEKIYRFRLSSIIDTRKNKGYLYDLSTVIKDLKTGDKVVLQEEDLKTGILLNGVSGTGKTSSAINPMIRDVMDQKVKNKIARHEALAKMLEAEKASISYFIPDFHERALEEENFIESVIKPAEEYEEEFDDIIHKYKNAGITVMAPNNGFIRDVLRLAKARKIKVNVLDPAYDWTEEFPETAIPKKLNPFFIPENLSEEERYIIISNRARVFSEVIVSINEQSKEGDIYFKDINLSMTTNIATVVMAAKAIEGKQAELLEIQACIDNPDLLKPYIETIEKRKFKGREVRESSILKKKRNTSHATQSKEEAKTENAIKNEQISSGVESAMNAPDEDLMENGKPAAEQTSTNSAQNTAQTSGQQKLDEIVTYKQVEEVVERNRDDSLYRSIQFVKDEVLSEEGKQKMYDQARGLRNLLSINLLNDVRITDILSAQNKEELLNFDKILSDGEITVVNTAVEFSSGLSTAFGLFFQLNFRTAVYRRDKNFRPPHFLIIDEVSQYVNDFYNDIVSFYRQYNIISCLSIQSLTQLASKAKTAHLKTLFQGIGTHILYGRLSAEEMKIYQDLAGEEREEMIQDTYTHNSLLSDNPSVSQSERITPNFISTLTGSNMRYRNFQEVTLYTTRNGDVLKPIEGKVSFVPKKAYKDVTFPKIHWEKFVPESAAPIDYMPEDEVFLVKEMGKPEVKEAIGSYVENKTEDSIERDKTRDEEFIEALRREKLLLTNDEPEEEDEDGNISADELSDLFSFMMHPEDNGNDESNTKTTV